jgi:ABC-type antimicrobial peptide transport system permease subunit
MVATIVARSGGVRAASTSVQAAALPDSHCVIGAAYPGAIATIRRRRSASSSCRFRMTLFNYPGLGALMVVAAERKDAVLLTNGVMVTGVIALLALLLTDVCLIVAEPRIRFENREG